MVYFGCIGIIIVSVLVGKIAVRNIVLRDEFYLCLNNFAEYFKTNLSFSQMKINEVIVGFNKTYPGKFNSWFSQISDYICGKIDKNNLFANLKFIKENEKEQILNFVISLGKSDVMTQLSHIENFKIFVNERSQEYSRFRRANEKLIYKVSLAVGAVICILII